MRPLMQTSKFVRLVMALVLAVTCTSPTLPVAFAEETVKPANGDLPGAKPVEKKLEFTFEEGQSEISKPAPIPVAEASELPNNRVDQIFSRLPALNEVNEKKFVIPEQSLVKPGRPGVETLEPFPPKVSRTQPQIEKPTRNVVAPLEVQNVSPIGNIDSVPFLSITFSQPMVPVSAVKSATENPFVTIKPQPKGKWFWSGPQTLQFEPDKGRFPKATEYKITIPEGIKSEAGGVLEKAQTWSLTTPAVTVDKFWPDSVSPQVTTPLMVAVLDQDIDKKRLLQKIEVSVGSKVFPIKLVRKEEVERKEEQRRMIVGVPDEQWIAFEPAKPLPLNSKVLVSFKSGIPSAEGELKTSKSQQHTVQIHGPLKLVHQPEEGIAPYAHVYKTFAFSNPIDRNKFKESMVHFDPKPIEMKFEVYGSEYISITGKLQPRTKYTVKFDKDLPDVFDQRLGREVVATFTSGEYDPQIRMARRLNTFQRGQEPIYPIWAQGTPHVNVNIYAVEPEQYRNYVTLGMRDENIVTQFGGRLLAKQKHKVGDEGKQFFVDLKPFLKNDCGQFALFAETEKKSSNYHNRVASAWIQVTDLGVDALYGRKLTTLVTSLSTGEPIKGASVFFTSSSVGITNDKGIALLNLKKGGESKDDVLIARRDSDVMLLPSEHYGGNWHYDEPSPQLKWFAVSDRNLYKPGETVHVKGWLRGLKFSEKEAIELFPSGIESLLYVMKAQDGTELAKGNLKVDAQGGFAFETRLPDKVNLGNAFIEITTDLNKLKREDEITKSAVRRQDSAGDPGDFRNESTRVWIKIQEFRRPEFEMKVSSSRGTSMLLDEKTSLKAQAKYYSGSNLSSSPITWQANVQAGHYAPPGWSEYQFGRGTIYGWGHLGGRGDTRFRGQDHANKTLTGTTDGSGSHTVDLRFVSLKEPLPLTCTCEATVQDVNRQTWSDNVTMLIHPSENYVGLKQSKAFHAKDEPIEVNAIATNLDGKMVSGRPIEVVLTRRDWVTGSEITEEKVNIVSGEHPQLVKFIPQKSGQYNVIATITDTSGRSNLTSSSTYVQGEDIPADKMAKKQEVIVIPDRTQYKPGDTAEISISSPFFPAHGVVTIRRGVTVSTLPVSLESSTKTVKIPVTEEYYPNFTISVDLNGKNASYATGSADVKVPAMSRRLAVTTSCEKEALPGSDTTITIDLRDSSGKPVVGGQVAVAVADEALLALAGYKWPDPIELFYPQAYELRLDVHSRPYVRAIKLPPQLTDGLNKVGFDDLYGAPVSGLRVNRIPPVVTGTVDFEEFKPRDSNMFQVEPTVLDERHYSSGRAERHQSPKDKTIVMRKDFSALALFEPSVTTDQNGRATVKLHVPDSVTRYRIMAAAVSESNKFGSSESSLTARMPLTVKPSAPRFLNFGDKCEMPVVVQNETDTPMKVEVAMRASNARIGLSAQQGKLVEVPSQNRVEVRFPVTTIDEGNANFQCAAVGGALTDAAEFTIPVMAPASLETFAAYGEIDSGGKVQKIEMPQEVFDQVGGLSISTSSTAMQALTDAYFYLYNYQFDCSEQLSSRIIAMLSLEHVLSSFGKLEGADRVEFKEKIQQDIKTLLTRQNGDGGFGLWKADETDPWPYVSIQVAQALSLAREKDYAVPEQQFNRCKDYLKKIESHISNQYDARSRIALMARALNVRHMMKDDDAQDARRLINRALRPRLSKLNKRIKSLADVPADLMKEELPLDCAGWLLPVLSKDKNSAEQVEFLRRFIGSQLKQTTSTASSNDTGFGIWNYCVFYSPRRTDAILLNALMEDQPDSPLIPKLVRGLLGHQKNGAWEGTQENGYLLTSLDQYFSTYEKQVPDFEAQMWLGKTLVGLQKFTGRTVETKTVQVPVPFVKKNEGELMINREGKGRLYYRVGLDYAYRNTNLQPVSYGFNVSRSYEGAEHSEDVRKDSDGVWHIKSGSLVRAKIKIEATGARYHVALMDPLPAGAEPVNEELRGVQKLQPSIASENQGLWWYSAWYDHKNLRDHQAEAFRSLLRMGKYKFDYLMRATTPGIYKVPPSKAEEMYAPETFGRASSETVIIE